MRQKKFFFSLISLTILAIPLEIEKYLTKGQNMSVFFLVLCSKIEFSSGWWAMRPSYFYSSKDNISFLPPHFSEAPTARWGLLLSFTMEEIYKKLLKNMRKENYVHYT